MRRVFAPPAPCIPHRALCVNAVKRSYSVTARGENLPYRTHDGILNSVFSTTILESKMEVSIGYEFGWTL